MAGRGFESIQRLCHSVCDDNCLEETKAVPALADGELNEVKIGLILWERVGDERDVLFKSTGRQICGPQFRQMTALFLL